jgi:hypothetical protein
MIQWNVVGGTKFFCITSLICDHQRQFCDHTFSSQCPSLHIVRFLILVLMNWVFLSLSWINFLRLQWCANGCEFFMKRSYHLCHRWISRVEQRLRHHYLHPKLTNSKEITSLFSTVHVNFP